MEVGFHSTLLLPLSPLLTSLLNVVKFLGIEKIYLYCEVGNPLMLAITPLVQSTAFFVLIGRMVVNKLAHNSIC